LPLLIPHHDAFPIAYRLAQEVGAIAFQGLPDMPAAMHFPKAVLPELSFITTILRVK